MNDLQKKELELLRCFIDICNKLDLRYYLVCGSALGAVKYGGFIPWDDDIDVALPRQDYDKFVSEGIKLLPEHLFLQNYKTDKQFPKVFSKLRNSDTTYVEKGYEELDINHGVFIDIFALDGYPGVGISKFERRKKKYLRLTNCAMAAEGSLRSRVVRKVLRLFGCHKRTSKLLGKYEAMLKEHSSSDVYCNYGNFRGCLEKTPKEIYGVGIDACFEGMKVRIPTMYDTYLREKYGDYSMDPPVEEQIGHHWYVRMDLDNSFQNFKNKTE